MSVSSEEKDLMVEGLWWWWLRVVYDCGGRLEDFGGGGGGGRMSDGRDFSGCRPVVCVSIGVSVGWQKYYFIIGSEIYLIL